jgi:hypothetical protein
MPALPEMNLSSEPPTGICNPTVPSPQLTLCPLEIKRMRGVKGGGLNHDSLDFTGWKSVPPTFMDTGLQVSLE